MSRKYRSEKQLLNMWLHKARHIEEDLFRYHAGSYGALRFAGVVLYWESMKESVGRVVEWHSHGLSDEIILLRDEPPGYMGMGQYHLQRIYKYLEDDVDALVVRVPHRVLHGNLKKDILPALIRQHQQLLDEAIQAEPTCDEQEDDTYHMILKANEMAYKIEQYSVGVIQEQIDFPRVPTNTAPDKIGYMLAKAAAAYMRKSNDETGE